jgi:hypothetical protein
MCDYSLQKVASRPAKVSDRLTIHNFGSGTRGFAAQENSAVAVCLAPGTELAFCDDVKIPAFGLIWTKQKTTGHKMAIFRQINKDLPHAHHDALELPDGKVVLLTQLCEGQQAIVLQLPAQPTDEAEVKEQQRAEYVG